MQHMLAEFAISVWRRCTCCKNSPTRLLREGFVPGDRHRRRQRVCVETAIQDAFLSLNSIGTLATGRLTATTRRWPLLIGRADMLPRTLCPATHRRCFSSSLQHRYDAKWVQL